MSAGDDDIHRMMTEEWSCPSCAHRCTIRDTEIAPWPGRLRKRFGDLTFAELNAIIARESEGGAALVHWCSRCGRSPMAKLEVRMLVVIEGGRSGVPL